MRTRRPLICLCRRRTSSVSGASPDGSCTRPRLCTRCDPWSASGSSDGSQGPHVDLHLVRPMADPQGTTLGPILVRPWSSWLWWSLAIPWTMDSTVRLCSECNTAACGGTWTLPVVSRAVTLPWTCLDVSKKKDLRQFWHSHQLQQRLTCPE